MTVKLKPNSMGISEYDFKLYRGDTFECDLIIHNIENLAEFTFKMDIVPSVGDKISPVLELKENRLSIKFPSSLTQDITWSQANYDLQMSVGDYVQTILKGKVKIDKDITR